MKFVDKLLSLIRDTSKFIGDMIYKLYEFLAKPLTYVYYFFDGVFYFFYQLWNIAVKAIMIFVALIQFFAALTMGFVRTIKGMLTVDFNSTPINYPSTSYQGIQAVLDVVDPIGILDIVPLIILAVVWFLFVKKILGLLGGEIQTRA
jgi:hypothetical protein